jgi:predicted transcriptional regulator
MNIAELKLELIRKIININDLETLIKIEEILKNETNITNIVNEPATVYQKTEKVLVFNEWQQARIDKAIKQYVNGECISDEEAEKEIQIWFKEEEKRLSGQ